MATGFTMEYKKDMKSYNEDKLMHIFKKVIARRKQTEILLKLFGPPSTFATQSIFIYGHAATGKTLLVKTIMQQLQLSHIWINCIEMHTPRYLFEGVLKAVSKLLNCEKNFQFFHCDDMCDFLYKLKTLIPNCTDTLYIILDKAEILRNFNHSILSSFLKLQELVNLNVCVILISEIVWEKFQQSTTTYEPYIIHFPDYNKDELLNIMALQCPPDISEELYRGYLKMVLGVFYIVTRNLKELQYLVSFFVTNYVLSTKYFSDELLNIMALQCPPDISEELYRGYLKMVLGVFYIVTRNLKELQYLANLNFPKYIEYINLDEASTTDVHKLWKNIEPHLKNSLNTVYIREVSSEPRYFPLFLTHSVSYSYAHMVYFKVEVSKKEKHSRKRIKREKRLTNHLIGPKSFPLERMLAIFYSIIEEKTPPKAIIFSQIASLQSLQLLACSTHPEEISLPKYKCLASLSLIRNIGRIVDFDVLQYLDDFT
ncbi:origin recognition complex subunit 5-like [Centruroides sculpturatus]|uniref:origin recognition complex subunit 5-like n=1 Tax=Centruroides sculpturatus TaxID=218467 RepID=UPI000C6E794E|nr:origin recognition complex subunit 5-like [Centruroides sculpturatus]